MGARPEAKWPKDRGVDLGGCEVVRVCRLIIYTPCLTIILYVGQRIR